MRAQRPVCQETPPDRWLDTPVGAKCPRGFEPQMCRRSKMLQNFWVWYHPPEVPRGPQRGPCSLDKTLGHRRDGSWPLSLARASGCLEIRCLVTGQWRNDHLLLGWQRCTGRQPTCTGSPRYIRRRGSLCLDRVCASLKKKENFSCCNILNLFTIL